ncbi:MAG: glycosyltransferase [Bacteroidales bacterium]
MKAFPKILFLARWYPDRYDPMTGLFIMRHAEVATRIANVAVLYLRAAPEKSYSYQIEQYRENEVVTTLVYYGTKNQLPSFLSKLLSGFMFVVSFTKGYKFISESWGKPDIIHVNVLTRLGVFALWMRLFRNINYVITEHWSRYLPITGTYRGVFRKLITKIVVCRASAVSTVSQNLSSAMQSHGLTNKNYLVLPNVVDTDAYSIDNQKEKNRIKRFVHISCFEDRSKNISGILRAISKLSQIRQDFECIMVGEGIDLEKMKSLASDLQLNEPMLKFTGLLENDNLIKEYRQADFMVMFSNYENMPVVISESFSCGLPIIATSVGGIPEYVNIENGRLIAARDETSLLEAICYMLDHSSDFDKNIIRQQAVETFGKQAVAEKLELLYSVALKRKG